MLHVLQELCDLPKGIVDGALGLGGGIGGCQAVCGAVSGGAIGLSHRAATTNDVEQEARAMARSLAKNLYQAFATKFGCTDCRTLTGYDFQTPNGYEAFRQRDVEAGERFCNRFVEFAASTAVELLGQP